MRLTIIVIALVLVSGIFAPAFCQGALEPTSAVAVGQNVTIRTAGGEPVKGRVTQVTKEGILVDAGKTGSVQVAASDIVQINRRTRGMSALIGLGVGAGIGIAIGAGNPPADLTRVEGGSSFALLFGGLGAGVGAAIGMDRAVYRKQ